MDSWFDVHFIDLHDEAIWAPSVWAKHFNSKYGNGSQRDKYDTGCVKLARQ